MWIPRVLVLLFGAGVLVIVVMYSFLSFRIPVKKPPSLDDSASDLPLFESQEVILETGESKIIYLKPRYSLIEDSFIKLVSDNPSLAHHNASLSIQKNSMKEVPFHVKSVESAGNAHIVFNLMNSVKKLRRCKVHVKVVHRRWIEDLSGIVGWLYFCAWSFSYYPQIYRNWRRKSVVGLSFDYLAIGITGQLCYAFFNAGMLWSVTVQNEFTDRHPHADLPVKENDNFFTLHGSCMLFISILQCLVYETAGQRLSVSVKFLVAGLWAVVITGLIAPLRHFASWLNYLYCLSYIKLVLSAVQYTPQALLHYRQRSTEGWSIYAVFLDFSGGLLSFLQMFINMLNNNDWEGTMGNPVKLLLGLIAIGFNILFIVQHYILYRNRPVVFAAAKAWDRSLLIP